MGSTNIVTDGTGALSEKVEYYPYGTVKERVGKASNHLFTGKELDSGSGLYYYGARYYNTKITRFMQADCIIPDVYNPQNLNKYSYVANNPINNIDPSGNIFLYYMYVKGKTPSTVTTTTSTGTVISSGSKAAVTTTATTSSTTTGTTVPSITQVQAGTLVKTTRVQAAGGFGLKDSLITKSNGDQEAYRQICAVGGAEIGFENDISWTPSTDMPKAQASLVAKGINVKLSGILGGLPVNIGIGAREDFEPGDIKPPKLTVTLGPINADINVVGNIDVSWNVGSSLEVDAGALSAEGCSKPTKISVGEF